MRASLLQKGIEFRERDLFADQLSEAELRELIGSRPVSNVFSWNSPSFKKLGLSREELGNDALVALMLEEPRLIRRPLVLVGSDLIVGADKAALEAAFA